ncbi:MAG: hypothetical protein JSW06_09490 [Thermoplasmatales archaeon]|nr:MAG: hypothetical protein JSW06_09490 [Thermoplasmatales archaeon]
MHSNRPLRATLITVILVLGSLLPALIIFPIVSGDPSTGETTFYFHEYDFDLLEGIIDQNPPTKENDSILPPKIISKEFPSWVFTWFLYIEMLSILDEIINDPDFQDLLNETGLTIEELLELLGEDLTFVNPFKIRESYFYLGEETVAVKGDVTYNLYFLPNWRPLLQRYRDNVEVNLYLNNKVIANKTFTLTQKILDRRPKPHTITIENVDFSLKPEDELSFSVEIVPANKTIHWMVERGGIIRQRSEEDIKNLIETVAIFLSNRDRFTRVKSIGETIKLFLNESEVSAINITLGDFAEFFNAIVSSSFVYDSVAHPSSVTLEFRLPSEDENTYMYYLHEENKMDVEKPTKETPLEIELSKESGSWDGPNLERNKILKNAVARLYIDHRDLLRILNLIKGKIKIKVSLFDGDTEIDSSVVEFDRNGLLTKSGEPTIFTFDEINREIVYDNSLRLEISANDTRFGLLGFRRYAKLLYDSTEYPSSLTVTFDETDHIIIDAFADPSDEKIVPGGSVKYTLNITSKYDDDIYINVSEDKEGEWKVTIARDQPIDISAGGSAKVSVFVNSTDNEKKAYGGTIDMTFVVSGKTGIDSQTASAEISEDAIEYNVNIVVSTDSKNIKKGENGTLYFIIENKNTGAIDDVDSYTITVTSQNNWEIKHTETIKNLMVETKTDPERIFAIISVPKNTTFESDMITFTVTSDSDSEAFASITVTVNVLGLSFLESIYEFFESASDDLGFDDMFGTYAPIALATILMIIILFIIIILALLLTRKSVNIICTERIKEIDPDDEASFEITIKNPTRKTQTYKIFSPENPSSPKWEKSIETEKITIMARQSKKVLLTVKPTELAEPNDWTETKVKVNILGKKKSEDITIMTMVKDGKTILKIIDIFTWPKKFKKGDRVITSFKLENKGNITARNVNAVLYLNNKEKNKVEVTIPSGGYADIRMPWIAIKGKNKLHIKAIEQ